MSASFEPGEPADADRGGVGQRVGVGHVPCQRRVERRQRLLVEPDEQLRRRRRGQDLVEEDLQGRVGTTSRPSGGSRISPTRVRRACDVLGAEIGVVREAGLQLVDRLGGDAGGQDLVQPQKA